MRLLVVEDDRRTAEYVTRGMMEAGHRCDLLADGRDALTAATFDSYDVIVADRMIPELDGLSLVKAIRAAGVMTPVIFLTALGGIDDRVEGLESGGDDYLVKPFAFSELLARVNALGRRPAQVEQKTALRVADLDMDLVRHRVSRQGRVIELQPREFSLLEVLMRAEGRVVTRTMLLERVWDFHFDPKTTVVETHISRLRGKIDKPFETPLLHTIRNSGYSLYAEA
jgi:two-component system, OmpR family, response regulator